MYMMRKISNALKLFFLTHYLTLYAAFEKCNSFWRERICSPYTITSLIYSV